MAWIVGTVVVGGLVFVPTAPLVAVVAAQLAGSAVVVVLMGRRARRPSPQVTGHRHGLAPCRGDRS